MRRILFFLCCIISICATVYMCYESWMLINSRIFTWHAITYMLGTLGWLVITFHIVTRQYSWANYLCK